VNSSRSEATLAWRLWSKCSESSSEIARSEAEAGSAGIWGAGERGSSTQPPGGMRALGECRTVELERRGGARGASAWT
jgi:hypothetical protein